MFALERKGMSMQQYSLQSLAVTGATSSIGVSVIEECIRRGIEVAAIYRFSSANAARVPDHPLVHKYDCDLEHLAQLDPGTMHCDAFLHLAWGSTKSTQRNDLRPQVNNIQYALDAVELAEKFGCHTFMGAGSQAEYGQKKENLTEDVLPQPSTAYGMAKLCAGQMTRLSCRNKGMRHIWPRILSTYGPCSPYQTVLYYTIRELLAGRVPELSGGDQVWDFVYLRDTARALLALLEKGRDGEVYLVASGKTRLLKEFLQKTRDEIDPALPLGLGAVPYGPTTVMHLGADIAKIKQDTGWEPTTTFEDGIRETIEWVRKQEHE